MDFNKIQQICIKDRETLGWSNSFKGMAIPLFLLMLDKNKHYSKAGTKLITNLQNRIVFNEKDYGKSFIEYFTMWKERIELTEEEYIQYILWCEGEVAKRVEGITGNNHRNSYHKAAELIVQMGETLESNGKVNGKMLTVDYYKKLNSRKSAFKAEIDELI